MASTVTMEGPAVRERKRYIGFRVSVSEGPPPDRKAMVGAMDAACRAVGLVDRKRLTAFSGNLGIAKCEHLEQGSMIRALNSIQSIGGRPATVETLVTSGTIKKVKAHLGPDVDV
jgi:RNase P/RNase MRP subunit POP5